MAHSPEITSKAHQALHPVWLAVVEIIHDTEPDVERDAYKKFETLGGAVIEQFSSLSFQLEAEFEIMTKKGDEATERVVVYFPNDKTDLSASTIEREVIIGDYEHISGGNVAVKDFPKYAEPLLETLKPSYINSAQ